MLRDSHSRAPLLRRRGRLLAILLLAAATGPGCAGSDEPAPERGAARRPGRARIVPFPPQGATRIQYRTAGGEGTRYRLQVHYAGSTQQRGGGQLAEPQRVSQDVTLELHYRQRATTSPAENELVSILFLSALMQRSLSSQGPQGPTQSLLEIADDRVRLNINNEPRLDLSGSRRSGKLSPDSLLGVPFAMLRTDLFGNPLAVDVRGRREARGILGLVPLQAILRYSQPAFPPDEILPGATWQARRIPASPIGQLGLVFDIEHRLIAYEELDGVQCARVILRSSIDAEDYSTPLGQEFDRVEGKLNGEAWLDLATGQPYRVVMEDELSIDYSQGEGSERVRIRMGFSGRVVFDRLDFPPPEKVWADGTKRFASK